MDQPAQESSRDVDRAENLRLKQKIKNMEKQKEETEALLRLVFC